MKCGLCGANYIMRDVRSYMCSSHVNSGKHLCGNDIRVRRDIAEAAILKNIKNRLLSDDAIRYITEQTEKAIKVLEQQPDDKALLVDRLRVIDSKLAKVTDAIESVGISSALAQRLADLERDKAETECAIENVPAPVQYHPGMVDHVVGQVQDLAGNLESIGNDPRATLEDIEGVRTNLRALLGTITLKPDDDGVLWAHPSPNAKGPAWGPSGGVRINTPESGSGGRI